MSALASAALVIALVGGIFPWLLRLERTGRSATVVYLLLGLLVLESALYPDESRIPTGLIHPGGGALSFRLVDVLIPVALLARALARGFPRRLELTALWWTVLLFWLGFAAVEGALNGNSLSLDMFEAKAILYLGLFALAAGVPLAEYVKPERLERLLIGAAVLAALLVFTDQAGISMTLGIPVFPLASTGEMGADAATLFASLGIIAAVVGACREERRLRLLLASTPLLISTVAATQRAALLGVVVSLVALALLVPLAGRRVRTTPTELGLLGLAMVGLLLVPFVVAASTGLGGSASVPLSTTLSSTLNSGEKRLSAKARVAQFGAARRLIEQRPVFGWGLGKTYSYYDPGPRQFAVTNLTHNIGTDLLLRTGVFGLALFLASVISSLSAGIAVWRRYPGEAAVAAFALAAVADLAGLMAKGMAESLFEKYRLAAFMGLLAGALVSAAATRERVSEPEPSVLPRAQPALR